MRRAGLIVAFAAAACAASPAFAGDDPPAQPGTTQGPMAVERVQNGWVIAPDVQVGKVGNSTTTMVGAYGGWMFQNTILVGGAGYFQTNRSDPRTIDYGGAIVEWLAATDRPIGFGARALVGAGRASLKASLAGLPIEGDRDHGFFIHEPMLGHLIPVDLPVPVQLGRIEFTQDFAIFEPQADLLVNIGPRLRVRAAAGYRFIGAGRGWSRELNGALGSVGLEIGGSSSKRVAP